MAKYVLRAPNFPDPPLDRERLVDYVRRDLIPAITNAVLGHLHILPDSLSGELRGRTYTEATKPAAADAGSAAIILSSDAATKPQMSDGTSWILLGGGGSTTFLGMDKWGIGGRQESLPTPAPAAGPPAFLSLAKWGTD